MRRQSIVSEMSGTADEAKSTKEVRATVKWGQSPDVPCLEPSLPVDSLLCEIISLTGFQVLPANVVRHRSQIINQPMLYLLLGGGFCLSLPCDFED